MAATPRKTCRRCISGGLGRKEIRGVGLVFESYCDCPLGEVAKAYDAAKVADGGKANAEWLWHVSGVPVVLYDATLDTTPHQDIAALMRFPKSMDLVAGESWPDALREWRRGWFLRGAYGVGKTGLAVGYAREWLLAGMGRVRFRTVPNLLADIRATFNHDTGQRQEEDVVRDYSEVPLLVLDDLGSERITEANAAWVQDVFLRIIGERHDGLKTTVFTSNSSLESMEDRITPRLAHRIAEMCGPGHMKHVQGPNLRGRLAKE